MTMGRKAQTSIEFMAVIAAVIFVAAIVQLLIFTKYNEAWHVRAYLGSQDLCNTMADELGIAAYSEGRSAFFKLPYDISGANYTLTVWNGTVTADYSDHVCVRRFVAREVRYNNASVPFNLTGGTYRINTTGGLITLEKFY